MADETYYSLLGISETASAGEVKIAYLRLMREIHPDRLTNAPPYWQRQAEEKSKEVNEAYTVLSDQVKRRLYDVQLAGYRGASVAATGADFRGRRTKSAKNPSKSTQHTASTPSSSTHTPSQSSSQTLSSQLNKAQRLFFALIGSGLALGAANIFWSASSTTEGGLAFILALILFFGVACLYQPFMARIFSALPLKIPKQSLWLTIGTIVLFLCVGKIVSLGGDTHFRGSNDYPATNVQKSEVTLANGSLSSTRVKGYSNERYPAAYNFTGEIQNRSAVTVSLIRVKIKIFDCSITSSPSLYTFYGITYQSGIYDPSPPSNCKHIGEEEEDDFPHAAPGETSGFGNFYFPRRPQGTLRWNYEITKMEIHAVQVSTPAPAAMVPALGPPLQNSSTHETISKVQSERQPYSQASSQIAAQENQKNTETGAISTTASNDALSGNPSNAAPGKTQAVWRRALSGSTWIGTYNCAQGLTGLTLKIAQSSGGRLTGIFNFYPVAGDQHFPSGSYSGTITTGPGTSFRFEPQDWISQPPGFAAVALSGFYVVPSQRLQGQVTGAMGCTSFDLSRESQARPPLSAYELSSVPSPDRASIESACSGARLVEGAASYHRCLETQLKELAKHPEAPDLSRLSSVDRTSIESACSGARLVEGTASYHKCLITQLRELAGHPLVPDLSTLTSIDRASMESACAGNRLVEGAASYHRCLISQLKQLVQYPDAPDLAGLSRVDRNSIESACSGAKLVEGPASYHRCLVRQLSALRGK